MAFADFPRIDDYGDAAAEARACRNDCALFDFSFLECARVKGVRARHVIETFTGRSLVAMDVGKIYYALRVNSAGTVDADLTVWRTDENSYDVMSGRRADIADLLRQYDSGVEVADIGNTAVFALQGPRALDVLSRLGDITRIEHLSYFNFSEAALSGVLCRIGRLGYTGEAGFEIIAPRAEAPDLWKTLSAYVQPAGFVAADMLRIEAGFVLFCNEFRLPVSPEEVGLGSYRRSADLGPPELALISFRADADALRMPWQPSGGLRRPIEPDEIAVTSACRSNAAGGGILGLGYVRAGTDFYVGLRDPTGIFRAIRRTPLPFYDTAKRRPRVAWR